MCGGGGGDIQGTEGYVKERRGGIEWERRGRKNAEVHINACKTAVFHLDSGSLSKNSSIAFFFLFLYLEQEPSHTQTLVMERKRQLYPTTDASGTKCMAENFSTENTEEKLLKILMQILKMCNLSMFVCFAFFLKKVYCPINNGLH